MGLADSKTNQKKKVRAIVQKAAALEKLVEDFSFDIENGLDTVEYLLCEGCRKKDFLTFVKEFEAMTGPDMAHHLVAALFHFYLRTGKISILIPGDDKYSYIDLDGEEPDFKLPGDLTSEGSRSNSEPWQNGSLDRESIVLHSKEMNRILYLYINSKG